MNEVNVHDATAALYCTFWVDGYWFGVDAQQVREVHALPELTPIPGAPRAVAGYVNLRGQLYLALDAREMLTSAATGAAAAHLVVFRPSAGESFALVVDSLGDMVEAAHDRIDVAKRPAEAAGSAPLTLGHARLERGMLALIDPRLLLTAALGNN